MTEPASPALRRKLTLGDVTIAVVTGAIFVGSLAVRSRLVFAIVVVAAIFVPMERIFALRSQRVFRARWRTDLVHFVVNNLLTTGLLIVAVVTIGTSLRAAVPGSLRGGVASQSLWLQFTEAFLIAELCGYWAHRATHTVPILWRFHRVHHSIGEMDWLAAGRLHPVDQAFTRSCIVLPLVALGFT
ncbi:MAG TPA: sterol desaturase family protein, partial [Acidimicrobiales bacterium]|nr:sterol desaturase family protein [Acidimicrobiales bacterium]